ncbi:MAG: hypothetical protein ABTQ32_14610 [Myxococcaceae bacterium]
MNRSFLSVATAAVISLLASGCIIVGNNRLAGDITVVWSFNGQTCLFVPQVQSVRVTIPGAQLQNNGIYPCMSNNVAGITLLNFRGGTYNITVEGLDSAGRVVYRGTTSAVVDGNVSVSVNLLPQQGATGSAIISWVFPNNLACGQVGDVAGGRPVSRMSVSIDNATPSIVDCTRGNPTAANPSAAITIDNLTGSHVIDVIAMDSANFPYLRATNTITAMVGGAAANTLQLQWVVGSLPLRWSFLNQGVTITCQQAQVTQVYVNFRNQQTQQLVFSDNNGAGPAIPCVSTNNIQGTFWPYFAAGNYDVFVQAPITGGAYTYKTQQTAPNIPVLQVQAGVFAQSEAMGQQLVLQ